MLQSILPRIFLLAFRAATPVVAAGFVRHDPAATRVALRRLLEAGGVTTIKIGQYLAIRRDLFSEETCAELSRLFDAVPAMPPALVRRLVEGELGTPMEHAFLRFDRTPIGAASIAQVHRARTRDGRLVAVKVQRPGLSARLSADFRLLGRIARIGDRIGLFGTIGAAGLIGEIAAFTLRKVDFRTEADTAERIAADPLSGVHVPAIDRALSTDRLLVMDYIAAVPLSRVIAPVAGDAADRSDQNALARIAPGMAPGAIVERLARAFLRQLFVTGLFHGDPHPANILIERDGRIALIDFGIFGELGEADRALLAGYVENLALRRLDAAFDCYAALVRPGPRTDMPSFRRASIAVMGDWHDAASDPATPVSLQLTARYQGIMFAAMRTHDVRMGTEQLLFWRALGMLDSTAHRLPGGFDLLAAIRRFFADNRPSLASRAALAGVRLLDGAGRILPEAVDALAAVDRETLRVETGLARDEATEDAAPPRILALVLAALALAIHAATLAPGRSQWPMAIAAAAALAMAARTATCRHVA